MRYLIGFLALLWCVSALAVIEIEPLSSPELEERYRDLIDELRCPKCQNQNLADSNSPIAADLRAQVRNLLEEGKSDEEITTYLVERYGEFVRYRPAVKENTLVLWFGPVVLLIAGAVTVFFVVRLYRRPRAAPDAPLSAEERARLDTLLADESDSGDGRRERL